jgi:hypothetical protein
MVTRLPFTRWERDRLGKLVLRQRTYRVVGRPYALECGLALRAAAADALAAALLLAVAFVIVVKSLGCASADGTDSPPESSSPEAQPVSFIEEE